MDFSLSEEQRAFGDSAQALFADYCGDEQLREHDASGRPFMQELWAQCLAAGLHGVLVPESDGGLGLGLTELMCVLEQQGRALALVPLWEQQLAAATLARFGDAALRDRVLGPVMAGEQLLTLSLAGLAAPCGTGLRLERGDRGWTAHGTVPAVALGGQARWALLAADDGQDRRLLLADLEVVRPVEGVSQHRLGVADLHFEALPVDDTAVLPCEAADWIEPRALACLAALQLGVTAQQLARTVDYLKERRQFERPIGSFQLVAGQMADGHIGLEALRSSLWQLVYRLDAGLGAVPHAHATRFLACELGHRAGHMAQHVHGGMGVDVSFHIHRFLYWSRALAVALGGSEHHLARLGNWLADNDNLGWKYDLAEDHPTL